MNMAPLFPFRRALARVCLSLALSSLVILLALRVEPVHAAGTQGAAAQALEAYFDGLKSLRADFTQIVTGKNAAKSQRSSGLILVERPNRFRLEYTQPYHQVYVADGKRLWSYDADLEQVTVRPQGKLLANTPAMLLSDPRHLSESFTITDLGKRHGIHWFELTPRLHDSNFQHVALGFSAPRKLSVMILRDSLGQTTRLDFKDTHYNAPIAASRFHFVPPKGVDVIGE